MNIGNLKTNEEGIFVGRITTLAFTATVALREFTSNNDKAPAYDVMALSADRRSWVKVGALWEYASNETGEMFLSGRIDDPSLDKPLDVALFNQDDGSYNVAWRRPKAKRSLPTATNDESALPSLPGFDEEGEQEQRPAGDGLGESTYGADQQQAA
jgi:uncharacterized protein (DUF736 family)